MSRRLKSLKFTHTSGAKRTHADGMNRSSKLPSIQSRIVAKMFWYSQRTWTTGFINYKCRIVSWNTYLKLFIIVYKVMKLKWNYVIEMEGYFAMSPIWKVWWFQKDFGSERQRFVTMNWETVRKIACSVTCGMLLQGESGKGRSWATYWRSPTDFNRKHQHHIPKSKKENQYVLVIFYLFGHSVARAYPKNCIGYGNGVHVGRVPTVCFECFKMSSRWYKRIRH